MPIDRCPGQDRRFWKPEDIFEAECPHCSTRIEFWKDDPRRRCPGCGREVDNPNIGLGCAQWCPYARECVRPSARAPSEATLCDS